MKKPLTDEVLEEIASRACHALYTATFHYDFKRGATAWQNAEDDITALVAEVRRLRREIAKLKGQRA